jgi:hypothetical protein
MVRKFKLINANGAEWDLMRKDGFLYQPEGLGVAKENYWRTVDKRSNASQQRGQSADA